MMESVSWGQVLAWRMRRQYLLDEPGSDAVQIARRLAGVQAQVSSAAALAVGIREEHPEPDGIERALLEDRTLIRTWAMRGTLHLLPADEAGAYLAMCGAHRNWEKGSWRKAFGATVPDLEAIAAAAAEALAGGQALTRAELATAIIEATDSPLLEDLLTSGWGSLLKPLAWWGVLCHGPVNGNRVTFVSPAAWFPQWTGVPELADAAPTVIRAYLGAHGPTTPVDFDRVWLSRGFTSKPLVRGWFTAMEDELATVDVEGTQRVMLAADLPELLETEPTEAVRLLGGFDPYILGAGTATTQVVPAEHRSEVSRAAGWISPVVLRGGRAVGTWELVEGGKGAVATALWEDVPHDVLEPEIQRVLRLLSS